MGRVCMDQTMIDVTDIEGVQVADLLAYNSVDVREVISSGRTVDYAETIRLTEPCGKALSLVDLQKGNEVLVCRERTARHLGVPIDETIIER